MSSFYDGLEKQSGFFGLIIQSNLRFKLFRALPLFFLGLLSGERFLLVFFSFFAFFFFSDLSPTKLLKSSSQLSHSLLVSEYSCIDLHLDLGFFLSSAMNEYGLLVAFLNILGLLLPDVNAFLFDSSNSLSSALSISP